MMKHAKTWTRCLAPLAMTLAVGCAPAYHNYSGCYVDCKYCVPPPLPYPQYEDGACHACVASPYLTIAPRPDEQAPDAETSKNDNEE